MDYDKLELQLIECLYCCREEEKNVFNKVGMYVSCQYRHPTSDLDRSCYHPKVILSDIKKRLSGDLNTTYPPAVIDKVIGQRTYDGLAKIVSDRAKELRDEA